MKTFYRSLIHKTFEVGIFLKGLNGCLEIIGGVLLLILSPQTITHIILNVVVSFTRNPDNVLAIFLLKSVQEISVNGKLFAAIFLLSHGIIKLFLILALFQKRLWAYPLAIVVFTLFIIYQIYRYTFAPSGLLIILSVLDVFVILLTYLEYNNLRKLLTENIQDPKQI